MRPNFIQSIDVFLVTCFVMVFAAILEYAAVSYISNGKASRLTRGGGRGPRGVNYGQSAANHIGARLSGRPIGELDAG